MEREIEGVLCEKEKIKALAMQRGGRAYYLFMNDLPAVC